ncbi:hypothetical protein D3C75_971290 [compost metagenome]
MQAQKDEGGGGGVTQGVMKGQGRQSQVLADGGQMQVDDGVGIAPIEVVVIAPAHLYATLGQAQPPVPLAGQIEDPQVIGDVVAHQFTGPDEGQQQAQRGLQRHALLQILMAQAVDHHRLRAQAGRWLHPDGEGLAGQHPVALDAHSPDGDDVRLGGIQAGGLEIERHPLLLWGGRKERGKLPVPKAPTQPTTSPVVPHAYCLRRKCKVSHCWNFFT